MSDLIIVGWSMVDRAGWAMVRHVTYGAGEGELLISYWPTGVDAYTFRRLHGGLEAGQPDSLPRALRYQAPNRFRDDFGRYHETEQRSAAISTVVSVARPKAPANAELRWNKPACTWERRYRTAPHWRPLARVLGEERVQEPVAQAAS
jgi:hypothetical protein